ncbi:hypothetical protein RJ639_022832 [Escallonia herrerae]|uniref:Very-long-chain (3R)-3-hydroxyacyl-CoA dehydratase n=1 Tax=Escallonia herrerae TaxID=1293975 RepID=A0AA88V064_9ASTE|nr:hypothetical protein RJ639_022832 [Escallonia herrerae]
MSYGIEHIGGIGFTQLIINPRTQIPPSKMSKLSKLYLFSYNSLQAFGWAISLYRLLTKFLSTNSVDGVYKSVGELICLLQAVAFLEVIHGAIGIVPGGMLLPLMQWGGRTHFLFAIVRRIHEVLTSVTIPFVQVLPAVFITFLAWSSSEVIRYPYYALNCVGISPSFITFLRFDSLTVQPPTLQSFLCRYTAFIVLYPIGVAPGESKCSDWHTSAFYQFFCLIYKACAYFDIALISNSELVWLMYQALPFIKQKHLYSDIFARLPFSYYDFVKVVLLCYPFLWLKLYLHLFKQRRSKLRKDLKKKKN